MTMLGRLFGETRGLGENPGVPISTGLLAEAFGSRPTPAGVWVGENDAQRVIAVYRAWSLLGGVGASLPIRCYRGEPPGRELWNGDQSGLLTFPGGRDGVSGSPLPGTVTAMVFYETVWVHLLSWGNCYIVKVPNSTRSRTVALDLLAPNRVMPRWGRKTDANPSGKEFVIQGDRGPEIATPADVIHIRALGNNLLIGMSPIGAARQALGMAVAAEEYGARLFGSGSLMAGILQTDARLEQADADRLKLAWEQRISGLQNAHRVAVLDSGAKWQPIGIPPGDSQFIESRKFQVVEVARLYGIPPHMLGDVDKSTSWGTGIEQQSIGFNTYTLRPWLTRLEQALSNELLPRGVNCRFDTTELTRGDQKTRIEGNQVAILSGQLTPNEARAREGLPPLDGGDRLLFPMNYQPMSALSGTPASPAPDMTPAPDGTADPVDGGAAS